MAALERAEKADRNAGGFGDLRKGKAAPDAQAAKTLPGTERAFRGRRYYALALEDMNDRGRIEATSTPEKNGSLQQAHVGFAIQPVAALGALRSDQPKRLPGAQRRRGNAYAASDLADAQQPTVTAGV